MRSVTEREYRSERWPQEFHRSATRCGSVLVRIGADTEVVTSIVAHAKNLDGTAPLDTWLEYSSILIQSGRRNIGAERLLST